MLLDTLLPADRRSMEAKPVPSWQLHLPYRQLPACLCTIALSHVGPPGDPENLAQKLLGVEPKRVGREEKWGQSRKTALLRASIKKNPGKGENTKSMEDIWGQVAELPGEVETCQSSLPHSEVWKQPMCKACESCFGAKKGVISFCMCSKAGFPVCLRMTAWLEECRQERWCFGMSPLGYLLCSHPPGQGPGLWRGVSGIAHMVPAAWLLISKHTVFFRCPW